MEDDIKEALINSGIFYDDNGNMRIGVVEDEIITEQYQRMVNALVGVVESWQGDF